MRTREEGQELVKRYQQSNLSKNEFARREGIKMHVLRYWLGRVEDKSNPVDDKRKVRFIELQAGGISKSSSNRMRVELPTGATLHFESVPDIDWLLRLVSNNQTA
jgi:transposase-like protein